MTEHKHFDPSGLGPELVEAYSGARTDAELIRSVLEGSEVPCALWGTGSSYMPEMGASLSAVRVMVRPADLQRAREVIDAAGVGELDLVSDGGWDADDDPFDAPDLGTDPFEVWAGGPQDAERVRSLLEEDGIPSALWAPASGTATEPVRVVTSMEDAARAIDVIDAAGLGELDQSSGGDESLALADQAGWDPHAGDRQPSAIDEFVPWYSRPWGHVVMGLIALLLVVAMIATYALE
ncbi:MAG TPA: DUF2007 domain-containing protein [Actinomycetota bacterium]